MSTADPTDPAAKPPQPTTTSSSSSSFSFNSLSIYARAGLVIGCLLVFLFIVSTVILCIVRRGRLTKKGFSISKRASSFSSSVPKKEYTKKYGQQGDKRLLSSSVVEIEEPEGRRRDEEDGYAAYVYADRRSSEQGRASSFGASRVEVVRPLEEVALQDYRHGHGQRHDGDGYEQGNGGRGWVRE